MENSHTSENSEVSGEDKISYSLPGAIVVLGILSYLIIILPRWLDIPSLSGELQHVDILLLIGGAALIAIGIYFMIALRQKRRHLITPPGPLPDLKEMGKRPPRRSELQPPPSE